MKKTVVLLVVAAVAATISCKKKKDKPVYQPPQDTNVNVNGKDHAPNSSDTYKVGDTLHFTVTVTDDKELASINVTQAHTTYSIVACGYDTTFYSQTLSGTSQVVTFSYVVPKFLDANMKNCITMNLEDKDDDEQGPKKQSFLFTIMLRPENKAYTFTYGTARVYNYWSTNGVQCWNILTNVAGDKAVPTSYNIYNTTQYSVLSTPPGYQAGLWGQNQVTLRKAPAGFNYNMASDSLCDVIFSSLPLTASGDNASVGDMYIAQFYNMRKYAVLKVTNIVTTTTDNNDYTEFEYKRYPNSYYY